MMIEIGRNRVDPAALGREYPENSIERKTLEILAASGQTYRYPSQSRLDFELALRREIVNAALLLSRSRLAFRTFREAMCNTDYWTKTPDGGFALKRGVQPADAVRDIYRNSEKYGTECATAMLMIYYKALLEVFSDEAFNATFRNIYLMNWHRIEPALRSVGMQQRIDDYLPGDRRYFKNPDVDPETPEWQGENVIDLGDGTYYGHGIGRHRPDTFIRLLNQNRSAGADESAYLMDTVSRPDFNRLFSLYERNAPSAASRTA